MGLFRSRFSEELLLPFVLKQEKEDYEAGMISLMAYGDVFGEWKYCYASFCMKRYKMFENGDYDTLVKLLEDTQNKKVRVRFRMKKGAAKDFRIDLASLAEAYGDERFLNLELAGWGLLDQQPY